MGPRPLIAEGAATQLRNRAGRCPLRANPPRDVDPLHVPAVLDAVVGDEDLQRRLDEQVPRARDHRAPAAHDGGGERRRAVVQRAADRGRAAGREHGARGRGRADERRARTEFGEHDEHQVV